MKRLFQKSKYFIAGGVVLYCAFATTIHYLNSNLTSKLQLKAWGHRTNTLEKLHESEPLFRGIELDVVYDQQQGLFDIHHPPASASGLSLLKYLQSRDSKNKGLWLDFKNLSEKNAPEAVSRLKHLCDSANLKKERFIIESPSPQHLQLFSKNGFKTSYYLPNTFCKEEAPSSIDSIKKLSRQCPTNFISIDLCNYAIANKHFEKEQKLLWTLPYHETFSLNPIQVYKKTKRYYYKKLILNDPFVEVILFYTD